MKIEVDGLKTFNEMISLASHGKRLFCNGIEESSFPIKDKSKRVVDVRLLKFSKRDRYRIDILIKEKGFRPVYIEELLFFAYVFPEKQTKLDIISLDHYKFGNYGRLYPCLEKSLFGRSLCLTYIDSDLDYSKVRFAVTAL